MRLAIRKYRKIKGMRLTELAKRLGISKSLLSEYETGHARVPASRLWDIAQVLDVPIQDLFEDDPDEDALTVEASLSP